MRWRASKSLAVVFPVALAVAMCITPLGGCVYYNGVYNARDATRRADALLRRGFADSARLFWQRGSESAEAVLRVTPQSRWHAEMLLHAGRSAAMLSDCPRARERLNGFLALPQRDFPDRVRASLALSACDLRAGDYARVEARLAPLAVNAAGAATGQDRDPVLQADLVRTRAQAALASGAYSRADSLLLALPDDDAPWERLAIAASSSNWPEVERWLLDRAAVGDARPEVDPILRQAVAAGEAARVMRVVEAFDAAATPRRDRTRLQLLAGELLEQTRDTAAARWYYTRVAERAALDSLSRAEAGARLALLDLAAVHSIASLRLWLTRAFSDTDGASRSARLDRAQSVSTLLLMLFDADDASGAAMFLAGEVARDSLQQESVALEAWRTLSTRWPDAPLAPRALVMAARVYPDSAMVWHQEVLTRYATSSMAGMLRGETISGAADYRAADALLAGRWALAGNVLADTLRARRSASRLPGSGADR